VPWRTVRERGKQVKAVAGILLGIALFSFAGCAGIGPGTVSRDRFDYTEAISDSWKRQMLFNLVKIRYGDAPVFMDVSSVISQYQIGAAINLGATMTQQPSSSSQTLGAVGTYVDRPTITFSPIIGDKFARSMMAPIPPAVILSLMQGGYPVDLVFRAMVQEINGIRNRFGEGANAHSAEPEFYTLLEKMRRIQLAGGIGLRVSRIDKQEAVVMVIRGKRDPEIEALSADVRKMLGVDPATSEIRVVYGAIPTNDKEIALLTRSVLEVLVDLSRDIEVPTTDVQEKRVSPTFEETAAGAKVRPLVRIQSSPQKPADAFVSIPYRNAYFWIDDRDLVSKKIFSFLMFVFTLVETGEKAPAPVVTIPTG